MNLWTALMMSVTLTITTMMAPRMYYSWIRGERLCVEGDLEKLWDLLDEQNDWTRRHLSCGVFATGVIWLVQQSQNAHLVSSLVGVMGFYAVVCFIFAIVESVIAQKVTVCIAQVPIAVKVSQDR